MLSEKLILDVDKIMYERDKFMLDVDKITYEKNKLMSDFDKITYEKDKLMKEAEKREEKAQLKIAKNLLNMGMTADQVQIATNLPASKIKKLLK